MIATTPVPPAAIDPLDHQGLVVSIADRYRGRGLDFEDLVQEGNLGLIHACRAFRPGDGLRFSTLATKAIRRAIWRALMGVTWPIRLPEEVYIMAMRVRSGQVCRDRLASGPRAELEAAERVLAMGIRGVDAVPGRGDGRRHVEADAETRARAKACLDVLGPRDREIVAAVHGIGTARRTFAEIGAALGMSRQNVRGHYRRALHVVRRHFAGTPVPDRAPDGSFSRYRGVRRTPEGTFLARVCGEGVTRNVGTHRTEQEAIDAANDLARQWLGIEDYAVPREERRRA
jgi:RNA polymerase primary sigma factor